jgi:hypothetical protein
VLTRAYPCPILSWINPIHIAYSRASNSLYVWYSPRSDLKDSVIKPVLSAFTKLWKVTISFVMSVRPCVCLSVRMDELSSHRTDLIKFDSWLFFGIFRKFDSWLFSGFSWNLMVDYFSWFSLNLIVDYFSGFSWNLIVDYFSGFSWNLIVDYFSGFSWNLIVDYFRDFHEIWWSTIFRDFHEIW